MKKCLSIIISLCVLFSLCAHAFAADDYAPAPEAPSDFGEPLQETTYCDEDGNQITERVYFVPDVGTTFDGKSGRGWYKNEKEHHFNNSNNFVTKYYAQGYFVWGDGAVSVSSPSGGYDKLPSGWEVVTEDVSTGTGKYGAIFNNYAYVAYKLIIKSNIGSTQDLSVTIRVSESGNTI